MPFFESADELPIPYAGTLSSFGSPADGKVVKRTTFTLQGNTGSGMATISSDKYYVRRSTGRVELRDMDDSDNILDWQAYMDYQDLGNIAFRATYTVKVQAGTTTTYTNETVTMAEIDPYASGSGDGGIDAEIPQNLWVQEIHAEFGDIGGWNIDSTTISSDSGNVVIDSSTPKITMGAASAVLTGKGVFIGKSSSVYKFRVGNPADGYILWDDTTLSVEGNVSINGTLTVSGSAKSDDFSAGVSGWRIRGTTSDAEFQNIKARGRFEAAVFVKAMESAHAGTHVVAKSAGKLDADMAVPGSGTWVMTLDDPPDTGYLLDNNDICVVTETQGSTSKTWFTVQRLAQSGGQQTYTCTYSSGTRPNTFHKGNIVVDYGVSGQGFLLMTADATGSPFYSVRTHAGSPWSATTERGRFGNMNGAFGTAANYYGFGVGDYSGGNYLKYETNAGFKLVSNDGNVTIDTNGITGTVSAVQQFLLDDTGLSITDNAKLGINIAVASMDANTRLQIYETGASNDAAVLIEDVSDTQHGGLKLYRARASLAATQADDTFGSITAKGHDGSAYAGGPQTMVRFKASENTTSSAQGSYIVLETTPTGSTYSSRREVVRVDQGGKMLIGDTVDANVTVGLVINQGANDDLIITGKSSDVAHGVTTVVETDTYFSIGKRTAATGGALIRGLTEDITGVMIDAIITNENSTKSNAGTAAFQVRGFKASGTGVTTFTANSNLAAFGDNSTVRFILDVDGDSHQDVGTAWTNFDAHDDLALLNLLSAHVTRASDPLRENFGAWLAQSRDELERLKLVTFNSDGHHFVNWSRMHMLEVGALRQLGERLSRLESYIGA